MGFYAHFSDDKGNETHRIYSGYAETECGDYYPDFDSVLPETVGEFTGLTDKNGVRIFEGDIVTYPALKLKFKGKVIFWCATFCVEHFYPKNCITTLDDCAADCDIIGNIYDSPELLGGDDHAAD